MLQLKYGSYVHPDSEVAISIQRETLKSTAGIPYGTKETWEIRGRLQASTQALVDAAVFALMAAYAVNYRDLALYRNDGTRSSHALPGLTSLGGVEIDGPNFPEDGLTTAEFSTFRTYTIKAVGVYPLAGVPSGALLAWSEAIRFVGGGPRVGYLPTLNGSPQRQLLNQRTTYKATQHGMAVGLFTWPTPPLPIWGADEHADQREVEPGHPKVSGGRLTEYPLSWSYSHESINPFVGTPTLWRG